MTNTVNRVTGLLYANEITLLLGAPAYLQKTNHKGARVAVTITRLLLLWLSLFAIKWSIGRYLLLASMAIYLLEYASTFFRKNSDDFHDVATLYVMTHVSLVNFIFDRPGVIVGSPFSPFVAVVNIAAATYAVFYVIIEFDFNAAWGCYGKSVKWSELSGGYCSSYAGAEDSGFGSQHCIDALTKGMEGEGMDDYHSCIPGANPVNLSGFFHTVVTLVSVSFGVYVGSLPTKMRNLARLLHADKIKKNS